MPDQRLQPKSMSMSIFLLYFCSHLLTSGHFLNRKELGYQQINFGDILSGIQPFSRWIFSGVGIVYIKYCPYNRLIWGKHRTTENWGDLQSVFPTLVEVWQHIRKWLLALERRQLLSLSRQRWKTTLGLLPGGEITPMSDYK